MTAHIISIIFHLFLLPHSNTTALRKHRHKEANPQVIRALHVLKVKKNKRTLTGSVE